jgi:hypothetical protein
VCKRGVEREREREREGWREGWRDGEKEDGVGKVIHKFLTCSLGNIEIDIPTNHLIHTRIYSTPLKSHPIPYSSIFFSFLFLKKKKKEIK